VSVGSVRAVALSGPSPVAVGVTSLAA
jgi:hypothetical protein